MERHVDAHPLQRDECLALRVVAGSVLSCVEGFVWITFEPERKREASRDQLLPPGAAYGAAEAGRVFLSPLKARCESAVVEHRHPGSAASRRAP